MNIKLPNINRLPKVIKKYVESLSRKIDINKASDIEKAVELSTCLYALGEREEATELLKSFIFDITDSSRSSRWGNKCDGLALLAYIYYEDRDVSNFDETIKIITSRNFDDEDIGWLFENCEDDIEYDMADRSAYEDLTKKLTEVQIFQISLTKKEKVQSCCSKIVRFSYYYVLLIKYGTVNVKSSIDGSLEIINREINELKSVLREAS